jgi:glycosyltransferase involved in cell wall biosynthesis
LEKQHEVVCIAQKQPNRIALPIRTLEYNYFNLANAHQPVHRGRLVQEQCDILKAEGFIPDLIIGHSGWGEMMFVKETFPAARKMSYIETYASSTGICNGFDPELPDIDGIANVDSFNMAADHALHTSDYVWTATEWQKSMIPEQFRPIVDVMHEGFDTKIISPVETVTRVSINNRDISSNDTNIVLVCRNLEPHRGFHQFMRTLPLLQKELPKANIIIVGGTDVSYSRPPGGGFKTWVEKMLTEMDGKVDYTNVFFTGRIDFPSYLSILRIATVRLYYSYPFVASWSLMESMSCGNAIVASNTPPVAEMITDERTGLLFDFFNKEEMVSQVKRVVFDNSLRHKIAANARRHIIANYDFDTVIKPKLLKIMTNR